MTDRDENIGPAFGHDARRFARLLASEISLYHADKIEVSRWRGDVYGAIRDEIEAARSVYRKRVGTSSATDRYFDEELGKALVDDDASPPGSDPAPDF